MREIPPGFRLYADVVGRLDQPRGESGGITARCCFPERHSNGDANPSLRLWIGEQGELVAQCQGCGARWLEIAKQLGTPPAAWFPKGVRRMSEPNNEKSKPVAEYPYRDRHGNVLAVKVRWEPGWDGRSKTFTWRRELPAEIRQQAGVPEGVQAWAQSLDAAKFEAARKSDRHWYFKVCQSDAPLFELPKCEVELYRLPELLAANPKEPVFVVEGEKVVHSLVALGFTATTGYAGMGKWEWYWGGRYLRGRRVVVIPDRDAKDHAMEYGYKVLGSVINKAVSVRLVELPIGELKPEKVGGDLAHWLAFGARSGWSRDQKRQAVIELCKGFPEWEPKADGSKARAA